MKCHAGVEFKSGKPCPKCGAKLGEVCWPGINADLIANKKMKAALEEAERFMAYFAGETGGSFVGPGTPQTCLAQIRAALT